MSVINLISSWGKYTTWGIHGRGHISFAEFTNVASKRKCSTALPMCPFLTFWTHNPVDGRVTILFLNIEIKYRNILNFRLSTPFDTYLPLHEWFRFQSVALCCPFADLGPLIFPYLFKQISPAGRVVGSLSLLTFPVSLCCRFKSGLVTLYLRIPCCQRLAWGAYTLWWALARGSQPRYYNWTVRMRKWNIFVNLQYLFIQF